MAETRPGLSGGRFLPFPAVARLCLRGWLIHVERRQDVARCGAAIRQATVEIPLVRDAWA